jgi:hypothetical protein
MDIVEALRKLINSHDEMNNCLHDIWTWTDDYHVDKDTPSPGEIAEAVVATMQRLQEVHRTKVIEDLVNA